MKSEKISELTTNRMSIYLRCLNTLSAAGIKTIASQELAEQFNLNSAQIRKDLGYFGEFGVRGVGYFVADLRNHITKILGLDKPHRVAIVGAGRLGTALANYQGFGNSNFTVVALFDNDGAKVGQRIGPEEILVHDVRRMEKVVRYEKIDVAVLAVRRGVKVKTVDLTTSLESLSYFLARPQVGAVTSGRRNARFEEVAEQKEREL